MPTIDKLAQEIDEKLKTAVLESPDAFYRLRDLDDKIWRWVNNNKLNPTAPGWQYDLFVAPRYTTSVDDALTFRPVYDNGRGDGPQAADFKLERLNGGMTIGCLVGSSNEDDYRFADNEAMAIIRACFAAYARFPVACLPLFATPLRDK